MKNIKPKFLSPNEKILADILVTAGLIVLLIIKQTYGMALIAFIIKALISFGKSLTYLREVEWNNGICKKCGEEWKYSDVIDNDGAASNTYIFKCKTGHTTSQEACDCVCT